MISSLYAQIIVNRLPGASPCRKRWYNLFLYYLLGLPRFEMVLLRFQFYVLCFHIQLKVKAPMPGQLSKPEHPSQFSALFFLRFFLPLRFFKVLNFIFNSRYFFFKNCNVRLKSDRCCETPARERDENSQECSNNFIIHTSYNYLCSSLLAHL